MLNDLNEELILTGDLHVNWEYKCKSNKKNQTNQIKFDKTDLIFANKPESNTKSYHFNQCTIM